MLRLFAATLLLSPLAAAQAPIHQAPMEKIASVFAGHWSIVDASVPTPGQPKKPLRYGQEHWHTLAGGAPLIEEYRSQGTDGTWEYDTAAIWWDAAEQKYRGLFCADFLDRGCDAFDVDWRGETSHLIVMSGSYTQKGKRYRWRENFVFSTAASFTQSLYIAEEGSELRLVATIVATRVPSPKP
jgi:hypothetical protein